jgi:hypothetical protein
MDPYINPSMVSGQVDYKAGVSVDSKERCDPKQDVRKKARSKAKPE